MSATPIMAAVLFSCWTVTKLPGSWLTTEAKISSDMPLPMPRWVMTSPIHMSRAKPVVRVSTTRAKRPSVKFAPKTSSAAGVDAAAEAAATVVEEEGDAGGLQQRDGRRRGSGSTG